jgi:hypothetical protein
MLVLLSMTLARASAQEGQSGERPVIRAGMIGLDTSHVIAFTKLLNNPQATGDLAEVEIVAGFPGGTDIPPSRDRVAGFTEQLREMGLEIVDSIPALLEKVDVVLLESVDGRPHLEQARAVIEAGKPMYIDKPVAGSLADAVAIFRLAREHGVPVWSASSLRFAPELVELGRQGKLQEVEGAVVWGPCSIQPPMPELYFYGVHGVEALFTMMGPGCVSVTRSSTDGTDVVTGIWRDGRIGTYRGIRRGEAEFGATIFRADEILTVTGLSGYEILVNEIAKFFKTGQPPVPADETLEIFAFLDAAEQSKIRGGAPVTLQQVLQAAQ